MNTYNGYYKGKQIEVEAETLYEAKQKAIAEFKTTKKQSFQVTVLLVKKGDEIVKIDPASL